MGQLKSFYFSFKIQFPPWINYPNGYCGIPPPGPHSALPWLVSFPLGTPADRGRCTALFALEGAPHAAAEAEDHWPALPSWDRALQTGRGFLALLNRQSSLLLSCMEGEARTAFLEKVLKRSW